MMLFALALIALFSSAPAGDALAISSPASADPGRRPAPPIVSKTWINSAPIRPADLKGRVVLVEFWTFGCGNCQATVPAMQRLWSDYGDRRLVLVGVHTPETSTEREPGNVRAAIAEQKISFPVALDNDYRIWKSFGNRYWPTIYVIDARGALRFTHIGELHVGTNEWRDLTRRIDALLREAPPS